MTMRVGILDTSERSTSFNFKMSFIFEIKLEIFSEVFERSKILYFLILRQKDVLWNIKYVFNVFKCVL